MDTDYTEDFIIDRTFINTFPAAPFFCLVSPAYKAGSPVRVFNKVHGCPAVAAHDFLFIEIPAGKFALIFLPILRGIFMYLL